MASTSRQVAQLFTLALAACSSPSSHDVDAAPADGPAVDAAPPCDLTKPFGTPVLVAGVNTDDDDRWGWLTADERTLYFARAPAGGQAFDIYTATRPTLDEPFSNEKMLATSTGLSEKRPVVTGDGLTMYMEWTGPTGNVDIRVATRPDTSAEFGNHAALPVVSTSTSSEANPWISSDGLTLYLTSDRNGFNDIFVTTRATPTSDFAVPTAVDELNSNAGDYMGALSDDGLEIFFGSSRDTNLANDDIFHAVRATPSGPFAAPLKLAELSDAATNEYPTWLSSDRCRLMFTSNRPGGPASYNIWLTTRPKP